MTGEWPEIWVAFDDGRATSLVDPQDIEEIPADPLKNGDRVRRTHRRVCHPDVFGTVVRFEIDSELGSRYWVVWDVWDDDPDEAGPYTREELDRVNDLEVKEEIPDPEIGPNKLELRAGEGKIELLVNGRDIAPEISPDWTLVPPNDLGESFLEVRYPVEVPGVGVGPATKEEPMKQEWGLADRNGQVGPVFSTVEEAKRYKDEHRDVTHPGESRIARRFVSEWEVGE